MNIFQKTLLNVALQNQGVKTEINKAINEQSKKIIDNDLAKKVQNLSTRIEQDLSQIEKRRYVSSYSGEQFQAKQYPSGKNYSTLQTIFSEAPGSTQCADRIIEAVISTGYTIDKVQGEYAKKSDLKTLIKFFDRVNSEDESIEEFVGAGIENMLSYGNWFIEKVPSKKGASKGKMQGNLAEIYNLDTTKTSILVDDEKRKAGVNFKMGYERKTDFGGTIIYNLDEIIHMKMRSRNASLYGDAVLEDNTAVLLMIIQALQYNNSILANGGYIPFQINLPEDSNESDAEAVSAFIEKNHLGAGNAGKPIVAFKGAKIESLGISPSDLQYLDLLEFGLRQVAGMYGVPLILIAIPEGSNRAVSAESRKAFYMSKIFPMRDHVSADITNKIIRDGFGIEGWKFNFKSAGLEESESTRRDIMNGFRTGLYSFNEARMKIGLLPISDDWANEHYLVGSKNDFAITIENAITDKVQTATPKAPSSAPDDVADAESTREQGEGADEGDS